MEAIIQVPGSYDNAGCVKDIFCLAWMSEGFEPLLEKLKQIAQNWSEDLLARAVGIPGGQRSGGRLAMILVPTKNVIIVQLSLSLS